MPRKMMKRPDGKDKWHVITLEVASEGVARPESVWLAIAAIIAAVSAVVIGGA